jgi:hypothetical protein
MSSEPRTERIACDLDARTAEEQARHSCTSHPTEQGGHCEPKRTVRCEHGARELYRNQFPAER